MSKWKMNRPHVGQIMFILYLCVLFAGTFIRIFDNSFWGDEAFTIRMTHLNFKDMLYATSVDVHPPLYYMFEQMAFHLLGNYGYVYHLVSVVPLLITLVLCATTFQKRYGIVASLLFATFCAVFPAAIVYNVEARMYSWAAFFVLLCFVKVSDILKKGDWWSYILFALFAVAAAYTHYYAMIAVAFFYFFLLVRAIFFCRAQFVKIFVVSMGTIVAYIPWAVKFLLSFQRTAQSWWLQSIPGIRDCGLFLFGYDAIVIFFLLVVFLLVSGLWVSTTKEERLWISYGVGAIAGLLLCGEVASYLIRPLFITRYMYNVAAVAWLILAIGISRIVKCFAGVREKRALTVGVILCAITIGIFTPNYIAEHKEEKRMDAATQAFLEHVKLPEDELILTNSGPHGWTVLEYYYPTARVGETYDMVASIKENQSDCTVMSTITFSDTEILDLEQLGFDVEEMYEGEVGCRTILYVYKVTKW